MRWSSPVEVTWTRYRQAPPQHGGAREAGFARRTTLPAWHCSREPGQSLAVAVRSPDLLTAATEPPSTKEKAAGAEESRTPRNLRGKE